MLEIVYIYIYICRKKNDRMKVFAVKVLSKNELFEFKNIQLFIAFGKYLIAFNAFLVIEQICVFYA